MKIVLFSTSDISGGAAIAAGRMAVALRKQGHEVHQLVLFKKSKDGFVEAIAGESWLAERLRDAQYFLTQKFLVKPGYQLSFNPWSGYDVSEHPLVQAADVIQLHWINHGFMGMRQLKALFELKKPVFWHMHDYWAFTGGCHYPGNCRQFETGCGQCRALTWPGKNDLTAQQHRQKVELFKLNRPTLVGASAWLANEARQSALARYADVAHVPNPIDASYYRQQADSSLRTKYGIAQNEKVLLFAAMNTADTRKGFRELVDALRLLPTVYSEPVRLLVAGKTQQMSELAYPTIFLGALNTPAMRAAYQAADLFVIPSLEENLPNTILESLSAGTPVAGYAVGGIPEMVIDGVNGFLAKEFTADSLAEAIAKSLSLKADLGAQLNVESRYSEDSVANAYVRLFDEKRTPDRFTGV